MADYNEKLEYILDNGLECKCCPRSLMCDGNVRHTPSGPVLPACANYGYENVLSHEAVERVYNAEVAK